MIFILIALKIFNVLDLELALILDPRDNDSEELMAEHKKQKEDELVFHGHILNMLFDRIYDHYTNNRS